MFWLTILTRLVTVGTLLKFLSHLFHLLLLLILSLLLIKLLLKLGCLVHVALFDSFLDLIFELLLFLLVTFCDLFKFLGHVLKVFGKLLSLNVVELAFLKFIRQLFNRFDGFFHIAFAHRFGQLFGGS